MSGNAKCSACGSKRLIPDVKVFERRYANAKGALAIEIHRKPGALLFKDTVKEPLLATICGDCGHVDLRVKDPGKLYDAWRKNGR